ncbi:MAG: hypothetical protein ABSD21_05115 [Rhizomicrobium sp.]|jgi:hypothetical protein
MAISIYIDNNVWDFLFARQLDLKVELPPDEFCICITREAEFEIPSIPDDKAELKAFIEATIARCGIQTDSFFGFYDDRLPQNEQRVGGFDEGRWASPAELAFMNQQSTPLTPRKKLKTKLYKDEADISLAARSFRSVVLSLDAKTGPINNAYKRGGKVVFLTDFDRSGKSLSDFIKAAFP